MIFSFTDRVVTLVFRAGEIKIMISKLLSSLVLLAFITSGVGFLILAVWDVPVAQEVVEKPINTSAFLNRES